jgi:hypothetical protein
VSTDRVEEASFQAWVKAHFYATTDAARCLHEDIVIDNPFVRVHMSVATSKTKEELYNFASSNLWRVLLSDAFDESLLLVSPRELGEEEKEAVHAIGSSVDTSDMCRGLSMCHMRIPDQRLDYFVSHSWAEGRAQLLHKASLLRYFAGDFKSTHGRFPQLWLDKVD